MLKPIFDPNPKSRFLDLIIMRQIECPSQRGAGSMVDKYCEHAHQKFRVARLAPGGVPYRMWGPVAGCTHPS